MTMPIYEYQCPQCAHIFEEWVQHSSASEESPCPLCGTSAVHVISNTAFVLKGGGWYVTEYGSRKAEGAASEGAPTPAAGEAPASPKTGEASPASSTKGEGAPARADTGAGAKPSTPAPAAPAAPATTAQSA